MPSVERRVGFTAVERRRGRGGGLIGEVRGLGLVDARGEKSGGGVLSEGRQHLSRGTWSGKLFLK